MNMVVTRSMQMRRERGPLMAERHGHACNFQEDEQEDERQKSNLRAERGKNRMVVTKCQGSCFKFAKKRCLFSSFSTECYSLCKNAPQKNRNVTWKPDDVTLMTSLRGKKGLFAVMYVGKRENGQNAVIITYLCILYLFSQLMMHLSYIGSTFTNTYLRESPEN